ncbi:mechanosensitive ion channel family protein [Phormidium sp. LEGE 05292]|nr:mechanosensitive ion channel family protein [Phormidium sp. LEGE 05292]
MTIAHTEELEGALRWKPFGLVGDVAYAPVRLDGYNVFSIAAERKKDKDDQWGLGTLEIRRNRIENRLNSQVQYLIENHVDLNSLQVFTTQLNKQMAVQVALNGEATKPIITVTALDAEIYGLTESEVAQEYAEQIRQALLRAVEERTPDAWRSQIQLAGIIGAIAILSIALLFWCQHQIGKVRRRLRQEFNNYQESLIEQQTAVGMNGDPSQDVAKQQQNLLDLKRQIDRKTWQKRILQLLLLGVGVIGLSWILQCFPQTRWLGVLLFRQPIGLLLIGLTIAIVINWSHLLIDWLLTKWVGTEDRLPIAQIERRRRRLLTLSPAWKSIATMLLFSVGLVLAYTLFSLSTGLTLFTEIGVLGLAASLALQSSIKDALTGWMLLAKDAFTVGDSITIKDATGVVEEMGLFLTQIRSSPGELITIRNGEITQITNSSKDWSRMDFTVLVDYDSDIKQAMTLMREVFETMQTDSVWGVQLLGEPDLLGVEQFDQHGILLRIRTQTQPGQQFSVTREFRLRLNQAFKEAGIKLPIPQQEVRYRESH